MAITFCKMVLYYAGIDGLKGYELKTKLAEIISRGHVDKKKYSELWDIYKTADIDHYYENDGTILDIYSENPEGEDPYNFKVGKSQCGKCINEGDCYSREHIIPQSCFGKKSPMKNDAHFVIPTDGAVNKLRGNVPFGEVLKPVIITKNGSKIGINVTEGYSKFVFEPIDEFKGDIARMIFYFVTRYENELPNFSTGDIFDGSKNQALKKWELDILLKWHNQDPVSRREIDRNNAIYQKQHNRNPYIDNPEWVNIIWKDIESTSFCGIEDFENMGTSVGKYENRTWTSNNITWTATNVRTDVKDADSKVIVMKSGKLTSSPLKNGLSTIIFKAYIPYSDKKVSLIVSVNGVPKKTILISKTPTIYEVKNINIEGNVVIELSNASGRVAIDNLSWFCYQKKLSKSDVKASKTIHFYPNLTRKGTIFLKNINPNQTLEIFNVDGETVRIIERVNANQPINIGQFPAGFYFLKIGQKVMKLVYK